MDLGLLLPVTIGQARLLAVRSLHRAVRTQMMMAK